MVGNRSKFIKAFGKVFEIFKALAHAVIDNGGSDEDLELIAKNIWLRTKMALLIRNLKEMLSEEFFPILVDLNLSIKEMIKAGCYDKAQPDINEKNFSTLGGSCGRYEAIAVLVSFENQPTRYQVLKEFIQRGLKQPTLFDILAFGTQYPEMQRKFTIIGLREHMKDITGINFFVSLTATSVGRILTLLKEVDFPEGCCFLAIKSSSELK